MATQFKLRVSFSYSIGLFLAILLISPSNTKAQDSNIPSPDNGKIANIPSDAGLCQSDASLANMCRACAALPSMMSLPEEECCSQEDAMVVCKECLADPVSCLTDVIAIENALFSSQSSDQDEADDDLIDVSEDLPADDEGPPPPPEEFYPEDDAAVAAPENTKRYGTLFLGKRPLHFNLPPKTVQSDVMKREDFEEDAGPTEDFDGDIMDVEKRWGTLGLGSRNYGRYARLYWTPAYQLSARAKNNGKRWGSLGIGKRWGSLGIGNGKRWGSLGIGNGKRWGSLGIEKKWGSLGIGSGKRWGSLGIGKRWGSLGIGNGKRWGTLGIGKRWGSLGIGGWKRWGSLGLGSRYRPSSGKRWGTLGISKRTTPFDDENELETLDEEKRWGSLGLGNGIKWGPYLRGKRWGSLGLSSWRKRWGQLGLGLRNRQGKRWGRLGIGKRKEVLTPLDDDNENFLDSMAEDVDDEKRWGTLNIGKRGGQAELGNSEEKRWGTLGIGKRWGSLGGFGGFKRWGSLGLGFKKPFSNRWRTLGKRSADMGQPTDKGPEAKRSAADEQENRGEDSEITKPAEKKWGSLGIGKKWGSLGIGKKWGSLGIGKKWGSLGIGKKWGSLGIGKKWGSLGLSKKEADESGSDKKRWGSLGLSGKRDPSPDETFQVKTATE